MLPYEKLVNDPCDGYGRGWRAGWMRDEVDLRGRSIILNNEEKSRLYSHIVHVKTNQKLNGRPNHSLKHAGSKGFKKQIGLWDPITTSYLIQHAWGISNQCIFRFEKEIPQKWKEH